MRYPTLTEVLTLLAICAILYGLILPTPHEMRERELRGIAAAWQPPKETAIANQKWLDAGADPIGIWSRGTRRGGSEIEISATGDPKVFRVTFYTGSCVGGCEWQTIARRDDARLTLADPIADIWDDAFKTFWFGSVNGIDSLVPVPSVAEFNNAIETHDDDWHYSVFTRVPRYPANQRVHGSCGTSRFSNQCQLPSPRDAGRSLPLAISVFCMTRSADV